MVQVQDQVQAYTLLTIIFQTNRENEWIKKVLQTPATEVLSTPLNAYGEVPLHHYEFPMNPLSTFSNFHVGTTQDHLSH